MTYLAMALYPLVALLLFSQVRLVIAIPASLVLGFLTLPAAFSIPLPILPNLDKKTWSILVTAGCALLFARSTTPAGGRAVPSRDPDLRIHAGWIPKVALVPWLIPLIVIGPLGTWLTNTSPIFSGSGYLPGLTLMDFLREVQQMLVVFLLVLVGWKYLGTQGAHRSILLVIALAGLIYSIPTLLEIRLSPRIHIWIYGYFPHDWEQHLRTGGFRPVVLMDHALELSIFLCLSALSVVAYMRSIDGDRRILYFLAALWLIAVLVLGRSLGAALIAAVLVPLLFVGSTRILLISAALIALLVISYPAQRALGFSPLDHVANAVEDTSPGRAKSLRFRLNAESLAFERGMEKPVFGWGGWGRKEVIDQDTGRDLTVFDGSWLISITRNGFAGFIFTFGMLAFPVIQLAFSRGPVSVATAGLALLLAANLVDMIPNSSFTPITLLLAGALLGRLEWIWAESKSGKPTLGPESPPETLRTPGRDRQRPLPVGIAAASRASVEGASDANDVSDHAGRKHRTDAARYTRFATKPRTRPAPR